MFSRRHHWSRLHILKTFIHTFISRKLFIISTGFVRCSCDLLNYLITCKMLLLTGGYKKLLVSEMKLDDIDRRACLHAVRSGRCTPVVPFTAKRTRVCGVIDPSFCSLDPPVKRRKRVDKQSVKV